MLCCMQIVERGCALLGYVPIAGTAMVVLATRVRPAATLPGGHVVRLVVEHKWLQLPLQARPPAALPHRTYGCCFQAACLTTYTQKATLHPSWRACKPLCIPGSLHVSNQMGTVLLHGPGTARLQIS